MARAYRKKPVVVEAVQWTGENHAEMCEFIDPEAFEIIPRIGLVIHTLEGDHHASPGDYIIKGVNGEFYPCKPDIFAKTYESVTLTPPNEPLSIEQLREMDGEPVWVKCLKPDKYTCPPVGWRILELSFTGKFGVWNGDCALIERDYGTDWLAYRRPPEGGDADHA